MPSPSPAPRPGCKGRIEVERAIQYLFHRQWESLIDLCTALWDVALIGDLPIFVAHDSADVWSRPDLFHLGSDGRPTVVAGVPPDYFAATGQRWGNPLYDWETHRSDLYQWWEDRLRATFARFDMVRIDHFRGFVAFWEIPASEPTAVNGHWVDGPGLDLFKALHSRIGPMPIIAEDLGIITDEVTDLRRVLRVPGNAGRPVRIRRGDRHGDSPSRQLSNRRRCLHRHPRQRHDRRVVLGRQSAPRSAPPRSQPAAPARA